jgi:predicted DNA-binding transcriptional regulator AlpA
MSVKTMSDDRLKAAISVSKMCSLIGMSRSQFYTHVRKGTFHAPLKLTNGRPYYNASMVQDNLKARDIGIGVNGEYVIFYERTEEAARKPVAPPKPKTNYSELLDSLQVLGLGGLTLSVVEKAVADCYPHGTTGVDEHDLLRTVFRHLKRAGSA